MASVGLIDLIRLHYGLGAGMGMGLPETVARR